MSIPGAPASGLRECQEDRQRDRRSCQAGKVNISMQDSEILPYFDGRPTADIMLSAFQISAGDRITAIAYELGYQQASAGPDSRTTYRMVFSRDDSPDARRRAEATVSRLRGGGPVLPALPSSSQAPHQVTPVAAAAARRNVAAYESSSSKSLAFIVGLVGLGVALAAVALRDRPGAAIALFVIGLVLSATALATPTLMKRWYERNQKIEADFNAARATERSTPPPPPPGLPGQGGSGSERNGQ